MKRIPKLRFPEFKDDGEWGVKTIGDLLQESKIKSKENNPQKRITVKLNLQGVEKREVRGTEAENATYFYVRKKGQFIYGKQNLHKDAFGIIPDELDGYESSQDLPAFDFKPCIHPQFFYFLMSRENFYTKLEVLANGTGSKRVHPQDLFKVIILVPPTLAEQEKIAGCLSSLDALISAEQKKLELLRKHKKGLLQQLFPQEGERVPKLRFPEFKDDGEWEVKTLGEIGEFFSGGTPDTSKKKYYHGNIPFIRSAEIDNTHSELFLSEEGLKNSSAKLVSKGDILFALYGANSGEVAISKIGGAINQAVLCIRSKQNHYFIYSYLLHMKDKIVAKYLQGGQGNLSAKIVKSLPIPLPTLAEQEKIAACLKSLDALIMAQAERIRLLGLHKKGLLQQLFPQDAGLELRQ